MSGQYGAQQRWATQFSNTGPQIQLEEQYFPPEHTQAHQQHFPLTHNATYPPTLPGPYHAAPPNMSQMPAVAQQQLIRPQGIVTNGVNANAFDHSAQGAYMGGSSSPEDSESQAPNIANIFHRHAPRPQVFHQHSYPPEAQAQIHVQSTNTSDPLVPNMRWETGPSPQFISSPLSTDPPPVQGANPAYYRIDAQQQQRTFQFDMNHSASGSHSNSPGDVPAGQDYLHQPKRVRPNEDDDNPVAYYIDVGMDHEAEGLQDGKTPSKTKLGACARCKSLKVRCEFNAMSPDDPCQRCMNAGKDCFIPGRKKRRTPPKREHLLGQIREQAAQISKLMAQLEQTKISPAQAQSHPTTHTSSSDPRSSPSVDLHIHSPLTPSSPDSANPAPTADVEEWIAKARESIEAFGGFIGAGGASLTQDYLVDEDPEDAGSSGDDYGFEIVREDEEGEASGASVSEHDSHDAVLVHTAGSEYRRSTSREGGPAKKTSGGATQKLASLPSEATPFGLIANLALKNPKRKNSPDVEGEDAVGVANEDFFRPSPEPELMKSRVLTEQRQAPHILTRGIVTPDEAEMLFRIYFDNMGLSISLLDPVLYTAQKTCWRSPFLFTVICAIASRYYSDKPDLYSTLMEYAQLAAGTALISSQKNVEMCQAYILLSLYPVPARRYEDDRSWLYLGLAIRVAVDLNLNLPNTAKPINEQHAREMLNRNRVWLNCFNLDRSTGTQYGKRPIIDNTNYFANNSANWWHSSEYNMINFDIQLCGYTAELRVMADFVKKIYSDPNHPTGLNKDVDFQLLAAETDEQLKCLGEEWMARLDQTDQTDPQNRFRTGLLRLAYSYARLVALSFGFQHAFGKNNVDENPFLERCLAAAYDVVETYVNDVGRPAQRIYLRHGPEAQSVFVTFACSFLVKLLQPKFAAYLTRGKRLEIRSQVEKVANLLGSPEVAIDDRHGPKLYSRFLKGLLATPLASVDVPTPVIPSKSLPQRRSARKQKFEAGHTADAGQSPEIGSSNGSDFASPPTTFQSPSADASLDVFAPMTGAYPALVSQAHYASASRAPDTVDPATMNNSDWFPTPLPFDSELVQSMQSVQDIFGQDISLPGFNWMNSFQSNSDDIYMQYSDPGADVFDYNLKTPPP